MRILIVDDEESERRVLRDILVVEKRLDEIAEASDGLEGINRLLEGKPFDLCIVDVRMPDVDGMQMLQRLRRDPVLRALPVIVGSGNRDRAVVLALAQLGISGYLLKPFEPAKVLALVAHVLDTLQSKSEKAAAAAVTHAALLNTLLLVDDAAEVRTVIADCALRTHEWAVVEAKNGQEALAVLKGGLRPTLCLCDMRMPVMDGLEFVKAVRAIPEIAKLPVLMITGDSSADTVRRFAELHVSGYLVKPVDIDKIVAILRHPPLHT